jgi:hypothetical protein
VAEVSESASAAVVSGQVRAVSQLTCAKRHCGVDCEGTGEVPSSPGLTQELTGLVPCQRFVGWGGLGASLNHRTMS